MIQKNMLTLAIAGALASLLVACGGDSASEKAASTPEAKKSISAAQELTKGARSAEEAQKLNSDYYEIDLGKGLTAITSGRSYYLLGNFFPRDPASMTYTPFSWPLDEEGMYTNTDPKALAMLEYFAPFFPKEDVMKFYASYYYPDYRNGTHFDKQDILQKPEVQAKLSEIYERGMQRSLDVSIPVTFESMGSLEYNAEKNRFEFAMSYLMPNRAGFHLDASKATVYDRSNLILDFMYFGTTAKASDSVMEKLEPGFAEKEQNRPLHFTLPEEQARELAKWISQHPYDIKDLRYEYLGRVLHTSIGKNMAYGEVLIAPDALRIAMPDGKPVVTLPMPVKVQYSSVDVRNSAPSYLKGWLSGDRDRSQQFFVPGQAAAQ